VNGRYEAVLHTAAFLGVPRDEILPSDACLRNCFVKAVRATGPIYQKAVRTCNLSTEEGRKELNQINIVVMEFCSGRTLIEIVSGREYTSFDEIRHLCKDIEPTALINFIQPVSTQGSKQGESGGHVFVQTGQTEDTGIVDTAPASLSEQEKKWAFVNSPEAWLNLSVTDRREYDMMCHARGWRWHWGKARREYLCTKCGIWQLISGGCIGDCSEAKALYMAEKAEKEKERTNRGSNKTSNKFGNKSTEQQRRVG
jgi:hypothetical protein